eukprot:TRINITY_DN72709_c1_g1_i1.p2 TRINITY_DN72709_c1_g1~~TRINITY_DN72709_c1_g1_i1.p2  ORF type:complete len:250 (-),score=44.12 TRINITY_DN72709_c1_g1_i1:857-1606(-)
MQMAKETTHRFTPISHFSSTYGKSARLGSSEAQKEPSEYPEGKSWVEDKSAAGRSSYKRPAILPSSPSKRKKLEFEEQRQIEENMENLLKRRGDAIKEIIERNREELNEAKENLKKRYQKRPDYYKSLSRTRTADEIIKAEVEKTKRSLVRFLAAKVDELFEGEKKDEEEEEKEVEKREVSTQTEEEVKPVADNPFLNPTILAPSKALFGGNSEENTETKPAANNPFLNPTILGPGKVLFGGNSEEKKQ